MNAPDDTPFSLFGLGLNGVPSRFRRWFSDGGDKLVAKKIEQFVQSHGKPSDEVKAMSLLLAEHHGTPSHVLRAQAYSLDLISPYTGPLPPASLREAIGVPPTIKKFREFIEMAARHAYALALTVVRDHPADILDAIKDLIGRVDASEFVLSDRALSGASDKRWEIVDGALVMTGARPKISRSTLAGWRNLPEFRHIILEVGARIAVLTETANFTDQVIREIALSAPARELLSIVDQVPTVWSATPPAKGVARAASSPSVRHK